MNDLEKVYRVKNDALHPIIHILVARPWTEGQRVQVWEPYTDGGRFVNCPQTYRWHYFKTRKEARGWLMQQGICSFEKAVVVGIESLEDWEAAREFINNEQKC